MVFKCEICGKVFSVPRRKGYRYVPYVCSEKCFLKKLQHHSWRDSKPFSSVKIEKYLKKEPFKNQWEEVVFWKLSEIYEKVRYEPFILKFNGYLYVPDFYVGKKRLFIEVKGKWNGYDKFKAFADRITIWLFDGYFLKEVLKWL